MTPRTRVQVLLLALFTSVAGLVATRQPVRRRGRTGHRRRAADAGRSGNRHGQAAQRSALLRPRQPEAREARGAAARRARPDRFSKTTTSRGSRTSSSTWRSTARSTSRSTHIVSFIESLGMRFGADLNAYTSFDETVYMLQVPTDKPETLDRALLILEDWAHNVTFDPAEIDKERGVVMEEWRLRPRRGRAHDRTSCFPSCSRARATPTGCRSARRRSSRTFKPDQLKRFYKDWYRPDLMAVVAVGDFDGAAVENAGQDALRVDPGGGLAAAASGLRRARPCRHASTRSTPTRN